MVDVTAPVRLSKVYEGNNTMVNVTGPVRLSKVLEGNNAMTISPQLWQLPTGSSHADKCRP